MQTLVTEFPQHSLRVAADYWTGEAWYRQQAFDKAESVFARLAVETSGAQDAWLAMIPLRRAQLLVQQERWPEAFEIAQGIGQRFPEFRQQYEVDYVIGRCFSSEARFNEARVAYQRVVRSTTGGGTETAAMAQWMIGETFFHQREYDQAIRAYHRVESLYGYPKWQAAALLQAGKCHELKGELNAAVQTYAQLVKDYSHTSYAADAAKRLGSLRTTPVPPEGSSQPR
jgi:TolA-binding protein